MPNVPTPDAPSVMPSGAPVNVSAPPQAFGASVVGAGLEDAGKALGVGSDMLAKHAELQANLDASAAANDAAVASSQTQDNLTLKYRTDNPGIKAEGALPQYYADLDKARTDARGALQSPLAQKMFDAQTRLQQEKLQISNATWASGEVKQSRVASWKSFLDNQSRGTTLDSIDQQAATIEPTLRSWAAQEGWSEEQVTAARSAWIGNTAYALANGVAGKNPNQAKATLDKYGDYMNPQERGVLQNQIQSSLDAHNMAGIADEYFAASGHTAATAHGTPLTATVAQMFPGSTVTSTLRTAAQNATAGGVVNSEHLIPDGAIDFTLPNAGAMQAAVAQINQMPGLRAIYEGPGSAHSTGPHVHIQRTDLTPQQTLDAKEQSAPATLARIAADPRLRGDPILVNGAQRQYLTNLSQAREVQNVATKGAFDRLYTAMIDHNIADVNQLPTAYPGANSDYASLPEASKMALQRQAGSTANMWTPERDQNWQRAYGMAINDPGKFSQVDLTQLQLTHSNRDALYKMQQQIIGKKATSQANVTSALQLEPVKQALAKRPDLKPDSPEYDQFTGAFAERMQEHMDAHNGKIGAEDKAKIAIGLLGNKPAGNYIGPIRVGSTTMPSFQVSPEEATNIRGQVEPHIGRKLTDYEVGQLYARTHNGGR